MSYILGDHSGMDFMHSSDGVRTPYFLPNTTHDEVHIDDEQLWHGVDEPCVSFPKSEGKTLLKWHAADKDNITLPFYRSQIFELKTITII